eukprot:TRINITY_DN55981_c0_g1_i1.p1 TRINITY_DN55981_c0_g1~~TRINITY_DN55981_c0_g1_i1.p1  ORF type:complete len:428 (-),score=104.00 TRINITY_DN55981_c0_g1_i1:314-1597(-)
MSEDRADPVDVAVPSPLKKAVPVTILTGFLGSGKTTLMNHILRSKDHGMRFAIIENEFGEVGVDDKVLMESVDEEMIEVLNGCVCCTVRSDLVKVLKRMYAKVHDFDGVIIETTGLADPAPVAQTFFVDEDIKAMYKLDGLCTVVDAKHIEQHLEEEKPEGVENEAVEQVAFADRILLNKVDLVPGSAELDAIEGKIRAINAEAPIFRCQNSEVDPKHLINLGAFELERVLEMDPAFLDIDGEHQHDASVSSVSCKFEGELSIDKVNRWIGELITGKGTDLFRYKGIFAVKGYDRKFVFQGVHMIFNGGFNELTWKEGETRESRFVFIGRNLDRESLVDGLKSCKVPDVLRFKVGDEVRVWLNDASCGPQTCSAQSCEAGEWKRCKILKLWDSGDPYCVELEVPDDKGKRKKWVPEDKDEFVRAAEP